MGPGLGIDTHRFAEGRRLILGGVEIPHTAGLDGHSNTPDVLAHAITDAILGAAVDGRHRHALPGHGRVRSRTPTRSSCCARSSRRVAAAGWRVEHVDATVMLERP